MLKKRNIVTLLGLLLVLVMGFAGCGGNGDNNGTAEEPTPAQVRPDTDREGYAITLPDEINSIVTLGPSNAEILVGLGLGERIVAVDRYSADVDGLAAGVPREFGILDFDAEYIINLMPCVVFVTGMARAGGGDDPMASVSAAGISVIYMPISASIAEIMEDIRFIAAVMDAGVAGEAIVSAMQAEIDEIARIAAGIAETRTVYFEVSPAPWMFSFGMGTFLHEMIELVGAVNIFAGEDGWISVADEVLLEADPDVILTSVDFLDDPIAEIMERPGFDVITAVQNGDVFMIDTNSSNRPTQNITRALREIAEAVFPDYFQ